MNPWVIDRDKDVFGPKSDRFTPERWLKVDNESEEDFEACRANMKGLGSDFMVRPTLDSVF